MDWRGWVSHLAGCITADNMFVAATALLEKFLISKPEGLNGLLQRLPSLQNINRRDVSLGL